MHGNPTSDSVRNRSGVRTPSSPKTHSSATTASRTDSPDPGSAPPIPTFITRRWRDGSRNFAVAPAALDFPTPLRTTSIRPSDACSHSPGNPTSRSPADPTPTPSPAPSASSTARASRSAATTIKIRSAMMHSVHPLTRTHVNRRGRTRQRAGGGSRGNGQ
jgi:hypothetical protein